jgi:hypothetical protein
MPAFFIGRRAADVVRRFHSEPGFSRGRGRCEDRLETWAIVNLIGKGATVAPFLCRGSGDPELRTAEKPARTI